MPATLAPCPNRRCGVDNHEVGSEAYNRCQLIGRKMSSMAIGRASSGQGLGIWGNMTSAATHLVDLESDDSISSFKGLVYADAVMSDETYSAYIYKVSMESHLTDEPVEVEYTKGKDLVRDSGDPTAAEVLAALAMDRRSLQQINDQAGADGLSPEYNPKSFRAAALKEMASEFNYDEDEAQRIYDSLVEGDKKLTAITGTNKGLLLEALRETEGSSFDEEGWRYDLGMNVEVDQDPDDIYDSSMAYMAAQEADAAAYYAEREDKISSFADAGNDVYLQTGLQLGAMDDEGDKDNNYDVDDIDPVSREAAENELREFIDDNWNDVKDLPPGQVATDFFLTRNSHGTGFWDRGLGEQGDRLTKAAKVYGEQNVIVGDDGKVYFE